MQLSDGTHDHAALLVRAGKGQVLAPEFESRGLVAVGWDWLGDLSGLHDRDGLRAAIVAARPDRQERAIKTDLRELGDFLFDVQPGSKVATYDPITRQFLLGRVIGDYEYQADSDLHDGEWRYLHIRPVDWYAELSRDDMSEESKKKIVPYQTTFWIDPTVVAEIEASESPAQSWWVCQGASWTRASEGGYLWAPRANKHGHAREHWTNLTRMRLGDRVIHYSEGRLRAVSEVTRVARDWPRPNDKDEWWEQDGWLVEVQLSEFDSPVPLADIPAELRLPEAGPFDVNGGVKQGYLWALRAEVADQIFELLAARESHPVDHVRPSKPPDSAWDRYIYWGRRFFEHGDFDIHERDYKLAVVDRLKDAREGLLSGSEDWPDKLKRAFGPPNNLTPWQTHSKLTDWASKDPGAAGRALGALWSSSDPWPEAVSNFRDLIPDDTKAIRRAVIFGFLLTAEDPATYTAYRTTAFDDNYRLTDYPPGPSSTDPVGQYQHALEFLDRLLAEAAQRGLELRDRLDAQSITWAIAKYDPPDDWSDGDKRDFLEFREGIVAETGTLESLADELLLDAGYLTRVTKLLEHKRQVVFYGPPGTGKTYVARKLAQHLAGDGPNHVRLVQFHPSYAYEDFVEGFRPADGEAGKFTLRQGPLKAIAAEAIENPDETYILVIDEINRGNIAKVFGELYFLLEYRDENVSLQYSDEQFALPGNLLIIATMNTADRSIALVDAALRRRFYFVPFIPTEPPVDGLLERWLAEHKPDLMWVADVLKRANMQLDDRHSAVGPSHFMRLDLDEAWVDLIWEHSVLPYIEEQLVGDEDSLQEFELAALRALLESGL